MGDFYFVNGNFVTVDPESPPFQKEEADKTIHAENSLILPGYVKAHGHLAMGLFQGLSEFAYGHPCDEGFSRTIELTKLLEPDDDFFEQNL